MNKIIHRFQLAIIYALVFTDPASAQDTLLNKYGLWVIKDPQTFEITAAARHGKGMTDLKKTIPMLEFDLRYASHNNFTGSRLYPKIRTTYLRKTAADSLAAVQKELNKKGLGLVIFDAYRPYSVTERLWEPVKDDRYAADPKKGSGHNRGIAVDLSIVDLNTRQPLDMGTGFDNFSDTAHHAFTGLPPEILRNRAYLKALMERHGFVALDTEWWHFYLPDYTNYELLDLSFKRLKKLNK